MKLSDVNLEYKEYGQNKLISLKGDYSYSNIYVVVNFGEICENKELSGLAHLCEHIFLKIIENKYINYKYDENFSYMGITDYTFTIFKFILSSEHYNIDMLLKIIIESIDTCIIDDSYFEQSKIEVINECKARNNETKKKSVINSFLTDGSIDYIPIGNIQSINRIHKNEIINFINSYKKNFSIMHIGNYIHDFSNVEWGIYSGKKTIYNIKSSKKNKNNTLKVSSYEKEQIDICFLNNNNLYNENESILHSIINFIILYRIENDCSDENLEVYISIIRKKITSNFNFTIFCIYNYPDSDIYKFISNIFLKDIKYDEFEIGLNRFIDYISSIGDFNEEFLADNMINFIINNDIPFINKNFINKAICLANRINLNDINVYKKKIYNDKYKIIKKER